MHILYSTPHFGKVLIMIAVAEAFNGEVFGAERDCVGVNGFALFLSANHIRIANISLS